MLATAVPLQGKMFQSEDTKARVCAWITEIHDEGQGKTQSLFGLETSDYIEAKTQSIFNKYTEHRLMSTYVYEK